MKKQIGLFLGVLVVGLTIILFASGIATAAPSDVYWVNGSGSWSDDDNHWSNVSGGAASDGNVPTAAINAHFDGNSSLGVPWTVTVDATAYCLDLSFVGATNTPTLTDAATKPINIYGNATFIQNMTITEFIGAGGSINLFGVGNYTLTTGNNADLRFIYMWPTGKYTLSGTLNTSLYVALVEGEFDTNGETINAPNTARAIELQQAPAKILTLGASVINCGKWDIQAAAEGHVTITANTATIKCSGNFVGGSLDYNGATVNLTGATSTVSGNNSFAELNLVSGTTQTITFASGSTQNVSTASLGGSAGHVHTLTGAAGWNIVKLGGGIVEYPYLSLLNSQASPANTFYYYSSTVGAGVTGWNEKVFAPTAQTDAATLVEETTATLNGQAILDGNESCQYQFFYGDTIAYGTNTARTGSINTTDSFASGIAGLTQGKTYHFLASLNNSIGVSNGSDRTFITKPNEPSLLAIVPMNCSNVSLAWVKGTGAYNTSIIRKTGGYPANISDGTRVYFDTGTSYVDTGLTRNTTYYYRLWSQASEEGLTVYSDANISGTGTTTKCWDLTITGSPVGGGTPIYTEVMPVENGSPTHIYAGLNPLWYTFVEWTPHTDIAAPYSANTTITMTANRSIVANYLLQILPQPARELGNMTTTLVSIIISAILVLLLLGLAFKESRENGMGNAVAICLTGIVAIIIIETIMVKFFMP